MKQLLNKIILLMSGILSADLLAHGVHDHSEIIAAGEFHAMSGGETFLLVSVMAVVAYLIVRRV